MIKHKEKVLTCFDVLHVSTQKTTRHTHVNVDLKT